LPCASAFGCWGAFAGTPVFSGGVIADGSAPIALPQLGEKLSNLLHSVLVPWAEVQSIDGLELVSKNGTTLLNLGQKRIAVSDQIRSRCNQGRRFALNHQGQIE